MSADGVTLGELPVDQAHTPPGRLHRAFSVIVTDGNGQVLLQRRSAHKSRFAGRWSNTCCGHPVPRQDLGRTAAGRLRAEMGLRVDTLVELGCFTYRAGDPTSPFEEHEYDHVFLGSTCRTPEPDPAEVEAWRWVDLDTLRADLAADPTHYTPWLERVLSFLPQSLSSSLR